MNPVAVNQPQQAIDYLEYFLSCLSSVVEMRGL